MTHKDEEAHDRELAAKLGATTRKLREQHGLSLEELAHRAGFDKGQLGRIERADPEKPVTTTSIYGWRDISRALGLTLGEFFTVALGKKYRTAP